MDRFVFQVPPDVHGQTMVVCSMTRRSVVAANSIRGRRGQGSTTPRAIQRRAPAFAAAPGSVVTRRNVRVAER